MAITDSERELAAVGISVAAGCKPCTSYHVKAAHKAQVPNDAIQQAVDQALSIREAAAKVMERHSRSLMGRADDLTDEQDLAELDRVTVLISIGAAFGVNCVTSLKKYLGVADELGVPHEDADEIMRLAVMVKERAASHVERMHSTMENAEAQ